MTPPDLTKRPPRSPRVRLGGFVLLPRILDKCRATLGGTNGEYNFNCPLDQRFFSSFGVDAGQFETEVKSGKGDGEVLDWVLQNTSPRPNPAQILAWSAMVEAGVPENLEKRDYFQELHKNIAPSREDIGTWFELLDVDDFVSFGGIP